MYIEPVLKGRFWTENNHKLGGSKMAGEKKLRIFPDHPVTNFMLSFNTQGIPLYKNDF